MPYSYSVGRVNQLGFHIKTWGSRVIWSLHSDGKFSERLQQLKGCRHHQHQDQNRLKALVEHHAWMSFLFGLLVRLLSE